jgi:hypothetical protein
MPHHDTIIISTADLALIIETIKSLTYAGYIRIIDGGDVWALRDPNDFHLATVKKQN